MEKTTSNQLKLEPFPEPVIRPRPVNPDKSFEDYVAELKAAAGVVNEDVIGCYLCNYGDRYVCGRFSNSSCKHLEMCVRMSKVQLN